MQHSKITDQIRNDKKIVSLTRTKLMNLEERIAKIEERNSLVEQNKAWETSWMRRVLLIVFTYLAIALYLQFIVGINPWVNAIVPSIGFLISTLTLPWFRSLWTKFVYKR